MSFLDQMKLPGLIDLTLIFILACNSKGEGWTVNVNRTICEKGGSDVTILCTFTYPKEYYTENVGVSWKKPMKNPIKTTDNNLDAFVFHWNDSFVLEEYRGRTELIGNKTNGNCSLLIRNITKDERNIYLRIFVKEDQYSFLNNKVSIVVSDSGVTPFTFKPDIQTQSSPSTETTTNGLQLTPMYTAICVPVAALLIILFVVGIICYRRHKRSQSFTREESGYYANFSRAPSTQAERDASGKKQENKKLPDLKAIDEPIYINTEVPLGQMDQSMDNMDNVYANVDYTK